AETARETIKTAEGRTGASLQRGRRRPDFAILPDFRRRKRGAGRVFRTSASEKNGGVRAAGRELGPTFGARASGGASTGVWKGSGGALERERRFSDVGGGVASRPGEGAAIFSAFFSSSSFRLLSASLGGILTFEAFRGAASGTLVQRST
ncbi:MAG: hypothetical protein IJO46_15430, partial [Thermoguttaceae bacterium]|nr:hypothetical protein [Thermoguttaceae bacterium]